MWAVVAAGLAGLLILGAYQYRRTRAALLDQTNRLLLLAGDDGAATMSTPEEGLIRLRDLLVDQSSSDEISVTLLRRALDEMPTGAVISDADGNLLVRNRVAEPFASGRHGDALAEAAIQARLADALTGTGTDEDLRLVGPPERFLHIVGSPLVEKGELIGAIVLIDDVTEQHRVDSVRRDFVANVSHELRTPVGALGLLAETLQGEDDPNVVSRFSARIQAETLRLARLIDDLLDLSRIEGGVGEELEPVGLAHIIEEAFDAVSEAARHKKIDVSLELDPKGERAIVLGDHFQLVSAVTNLFENAVKYSDAGSTVSARLAVLGDEAAIAVSDTGVGIPQRDLTRVFERFYRVDRGRSAESGGTGLGLSIVRHVAVNHGGRVEVASQEGVGSTFTIILPIEARIEDREAA